MDDLHVKQAHVEDDDLVSLLHAFNTNMNVNRARELSLRAVAGWSGSFTRPPTVNEFHAETFDKLLPNLAGAQVAR